MPRPRGCASGLPVPFALEALRAIALLVVGVALLVAAPTADVLVAFNQAGAREGDAKDASDGSGVPAVEHEPLRFGPRRADGSCASVVNRSKESMSTPGTRNTGAFVRDFMERLKLLALFALEGSFESSAQSVASLMRSMPFASILRRCGSAREAGAGWRNPRLRILRPRGRRTPRVPRRRSTVSALRDERVENANGPRRGRLGPFVSA